MSSLEAEGYLEQAWKPAAQVKTDLQQVAHEQHQISPNLAALFSSLNTFPETASFALFFYHHLTLPQTWPSPGLVQTLCLLQSLLQLYWGP